MKDFFAHFGIAITILFCDVLFCVFVAFINDDTNDFEDYVPWIGFVANVIGFSVAMSFLILGK